MNIQVDVGDLVSVLNENSSFQEVSAVLEDNSDRLNWINFQLERDGAKFFSTTDTEFLETSLKISEVMRVEVKEVQKFIADSCKRIKKEEREDIEVLLHTSKSFKKMKKTALKYLLHSSKFADKMYHRLKKCDDKGYI